MQRSQTVDADHGRIETRRHAICHEVDWLFSDHPDEFRFPGLAAIGMVQSETERNGTIERERRFYLCSAPLDVESFARVVRGHWGIENRLHWVLDVVFRDDLARLHSGNGPASRNQAHRAQYAQSGKACHQPQEPKEEGRLEPRLPRPSHPRHRVNHSSDSPGEGGEER